MKEIWTKFKMSQSVRSITTVSLQYNPLYIFLQTKCFFFKCSLYTQNNLFRVRCQCALPVSTCDIHPSMTSIYSSIHPLTSVVQSYTAPDLWTKAGAACQVSSVQFDPYYQYFRISSHNELFCKHHGGMMCSINTHGEIVPKALAAGGTPAQVSVGKVIAKASASHTLGPI